MIELINKNLSLLFGELSEKKDFNISSNCKKVQLGRDTFYRVRKNKNRNRLNFSTFIKLSKLLGVPPWELLKYCLETKWDLNTYNGIKQVNYSLDRKTFNSIIDSKINVFRELKIRLISLFPDFDELSKRSLERIKTDKRQQQNFTIETYLIICNKLSLDKIKILKDIIKEI